MTIGPDPMTSTDFRFSRRGTAHPHNPVRPQARAQSTFVCSFGGYNTRNCRPSARSPSSGPLEQGTEVIKVVSGIVRTRSGLGVILHAEHRALQQSQALQHAVVEVDVTHD